MGVTIMLAVLDVDACAPRVLGVVSCAVCDRIEGPRSFKASAMGAFTKLSNPFKMRSMLSRLMNLHLAHVQHNFAVMEDLLAECCGTKQPLHSSLPGMHRPSDWHCIASCE